MTPPPSISGPLVEIIYDDKTITVRHPDGSQEIDADSDQEKGPNAKTADIFVRPSSETDSDKYWIRNSSSSSLVSRLFGDVPFVVDDSGALEAQARVFDRWRAMADRILQSQVEAFRSPPQTNYHQDDHAFYFRNPVSQRATRLIFDPPNQNFRSAVAHSQRMVIEEQEDSGRWLRVVVTNPDKINSLRGAFLAHKS